MSRLLGAIVEDLGGSLVGNENLSIDRLAPLSTALPSELSFVAHAKYVSQLESTPPTNF